MITISKANTLIEEVFLSVNGLPTSVIICGTIVISHTVESFCPHTRYKLTIFKLIRYRTELNFTVDACICICIEIIIGTVNILPTGLCNTVNKVIGVTIVLV